jgi:hypothetical protein
MDLIQEFSNQAKNKVPAGLDVNNWIKQYNIEFAKLIVNECAKIVGHPAPGCWSSFDKIILQHFNFESE